MNYRISIRETLILVMAASLAIGWLSDRRFFLQPRLRQLELELPFARISSLNSAYDDMNKLAQEDFEVLRKRRLLNSVLHIAVESDFSKNSGILIQVGISLRLLGCDSPKKFYQAITLPSVHSHDYVSHITSDSALTDQMSEYLDAAIKISNNVL